MAGIKKVLVLFCCVLSLISCTQRSVYSEQCRIRQFQYQLGEQLKSDGVLVIEVGDEVTLLIPSNKFFYANSNHLRNVGSLFSDIIGYINYHPVVDIQVKGMTDTSGDYTRDLALSRAQAQAVASYMWNHGLHNRLISAQGLGCHNPYNKNYIEIYFRLPPPDNVFH